MTRPRRKLSVRPKLSYLSEYLPRFPNVFKPFKVSKCSLLLLSPSISNMKSKLTTQMQISKSSLRLQKDILARLDL